MFLELFAIRHKNNQLWVHEAFHSLLQNSCSGNDACVLTTMYSVLGKKRIPLVGGTGDGGQVSVNGKIYEDAVAYALVKTRSGKVKVYKENMYRLIASIVSATICL
mgnify:CR=1 FL=1